MVTYYFDPSVVASGNGLSPATAMKYYGEAPNVAGSVFLFRADGLLHRPAATMPVDPDDLNHGKSFSAGNMTFGAYGAGDPILTGAVAWTAATGVAVLNGLPCRTINTGAPVSPFWFPRVNRKATYPSMAAPTSSADVDTFASNPAAFDEIANFAAGVRFVPAANYGGNSDNTKEVSYTYDASRPADARYHIKIKSPGFWARAHAAHPLLGHHVVVRNSANFTSYLCKILSYDAVDGSVVVGSSSAPNGGTSGTFFYYLFAHQYGLRTNRQYAAIMQSGVAVGWVFKMPLGGVVDIACFSNMLRNTGDNLTFDVTKTWTFEASSHGNGEPNGGSGVWNEQTVIGFTIGNVVARQMRNADRNGCPVRGGGAGAISDWTIGSVMQYECMGVKLMEIASSGIGGNVHVTGPLYSDGGGGGIRVAGGGTDLSFKDVVIPPRASIHDNGANIYSEYRMVLFEGVVIVASVNPYATQWNLYTPASTTPQEDVRRDVVNSWFCGRPKIDLSDFQTASIMRNDNGNKEGLYDRVIAVGGSSNIWGDSAGAKTNEGMVVQRSVIEKLGKASTAAAAYLGMTFQHCVFPVNLRGSSPTIKEYIEANGGTVIDCVEEPLPFSGTLTDAMWNKLTLTDDFSGHEDKQWLAPQLGLTLKAYGSARTLVKPAFVHVPFCAGHQVGMVYGVLINPNPLAVMSLPAGLGDNDKLNSDLWAGYYVIPSQVCPNQATFEVVIRVTDAGATNGPYQDFSYVIPIETFSEEGQSGTLYGPYTLTVTDSALTEVSQPPFYITVYE